MTQKQKRANLVHPLPPLYDENSKVLILGSFPSPKSREALFYYGHKQNRFWPTLSAVLGQDLPTDNNGKKQMCLKHGIAIWDTLKSCQIIGASDSSIRNHLPNDLSPILKTASIKAIFTTGTTAHALYNKFLKEKTGLTATAMPSTSAANGRYNREDLIICYQQILSYLK